MGIASTGGTESMLSLTIDSQTTTFCDNSSTIKQRTFCRRLLHLRLSYDDQEIYRHSKPEAVPAPWRRARKAISETAIGSLSLKREDWEAFVKACNLPGFDFQGIFRQLFRVGFGTWP